MRALASGGFVRAGGLRTAPAPGWPRSLLAHGWEAGADGTVSGDLGQQTPRVETQASKLQELTLVLVTLQPPPGWPGPFVQVWHFYLLVLRFVSSCFRSWNRMETARVKERVRHSRPGQPASAGVSGPRGARGRARRARRDSRTRIQDPRELHARCAEHLVNSDFGTSLFFQKPDPPLLLPPAPLTTSFLLLSRKEMGFRFYPQTSLKPFLL